MDPRLEAAHAALRAAQDRYDGLLPAWRDARAAFKRSRSQKRLDAFHAIDAEVDEAQEAVGPLFEEIDRLEALIAAEALEAEAAAQRALEPAFDF